MPYSKETIIEKFSDLHKKYYVSHGYMISTVNDDVAQKFVEDHPEIAWIFGYSEHAKAHIQTAKIDVTIFGKPFTILLERPMYPVERSEFECYFGFGELCEGYTLYRMIVRFATTIEEHGLDYRTLLLVNKVQLEDLEENSKECKEIIKENIDIPFIQDIFKLLVIGGYVKYWKAWDELSQWFIQHTDDESIRTWLQTEFPNQKSEKKCLCTINKYVFENY